MKKVQNKQYRIAKSEVADASRLAESIAKLLGDSALRWYIAQITSDEIIVEVTSCDERLSRFEDSVCDRHYPGKSVVLNVVPTGVGCSIGGYAGDAAPITNLLAETADYLITNPNAVNASNFVGLNSDNILYTDGCCIDLFCSGLVDLHLPYSNKVGLIIEKSSDSKLDIVFNVLNAVRAVHGIDITDYVITREPIGGRSVENQSGAFVGTIDNPDVLFSACEELLQKGVNAIAITSHIQDLPLGNYAKHFDGEYSNPVGGVEAIISYSVTRRFRIPASHAPIINVKQLDLQHNVVDARGAGEMSSESGLACILIGLQKAPQIRSMPNCRTRDIINLNNLLAIVIPSSCLGGIPMIQAQRHGIHTISVRENRSILDVTQEQMGLNNLIEVRSYAEAAGTILALKRGLSLESISRPLSTLRH